MGVIGASIAFAFMSKRPAIGKNYLDTHTQWHLDDSRNFTQVHGQTQRLPRYYKDKIFSPGQKLYMAEKSVRRSVQAYGDEILRLERVHHNPGEYYEQRNVVAHDNVTSKLNDNNKL